MALTDALKLSIDVQFDATELVTPVLAKTNFKVYQPHTRKQKPKTSIIAQTFAKAVDSLYAWICLRTRNLLDSYYFYIFSEPSLDIRTISFVYNYYLRKSLSKTFRAVMNIVVAFAAILGERISCHSKVVKQVQRHGDREPSRLPTTIIRCTRETT